MLRVMLLGERRLLDHGRDIGASIQYRKGWALLGYLAVECDRRHPREQLADLLWPSLPPIAARTNLRQVVANLNRVFDDHGVSGLLQASRDEIGLYPQPQVEFDIHVLERAAKTPTGGLLALEDAAMDFGGEFLAGLELEDCPGFEQWLQPMRARFATAGMQALRRLLEAQHGAGQSRHAIATARRLLALDPWDETSARQLMVLLAADAQHAEALQVFDRLHVALQDDLGSAPTPATIALRDAIHASADAGTPLAATLQASTRHWTCLVVCRVHPDGEETHELLLAKLIAHLQDAGAHPFLVGQDSAYLGVIAEAEPGDLTTVAIRAARIATAALRRFPGRVALALCPALVQAHPLAGLALIGNAGAMVAPLLAHACMDGVLVCDSLFGNLFETFALHPHVDVVESGAAHPARLWRLGAEGTATSSGPVAQAMTETATATGLPRRQDNGSMPELLTQRLGDALPDEEVAASAWLTVVAGADRGKRVGISERPLLVGRATDCDLHLPRRTISRHHCVVWRESEHYRLRDLGATNRTLVNGSAVSDVRLADGDRLRVGECILQFGREV